MTMTITAGEVYPPVTIIIISDIQPRVCRTDPGHCVMRILTDPMDVRRTDKHVGRQAGRQVGRQAGRQAGRQQPGSRAAGQPGSREGSPLIGYESGQYEQLRCFLTKRDQFDLGHKINNGHSISVVSSGLKFNAPCRFNNPSRTVVHYVKKRTIVEKDCPIPNKCEGVKIN